MIVKESKITMQVSESEIESIRDFCKVLSKVLNNTECCLDDVIEDIAEYGQTVFDDFEFKIMD